MKKFKLLNLKVLISEGSHELKARKKIDGLKWSGLPAKKEVAGMNNLWNKLNEWGWNKPWMNCWN